MIEKLITRVFEARNAAHLQHWATKNGEEHRALGEFYDDAITALDKLVEARQGMFGLVKAGAKDPVDSLEADVLWLGENRSKIAGNIPAIENIVDELTGVYLSALYKLKNLR